MKTLLVRMAAALLAAALLGGATTETPIEAMRLDDPRESCLSVVELTYGPGEGSPPHTHTRPVIAVVLEGMVESQVDDEPLRKYSRGEHWMERAGARHRVSRNASDISPARFLVVQVAPVGPEEALRCAH